MRDKTVFIDLDTTAGGTLPAELWFQFVDEAGAPVPVSRLDDETGETVPLYVAEWAAAGVDARRLELGPAPGVLATTIAKGEVAALGGRAWTLWVARQGSPSGTWARGLCRVRTVLADGAPEDEAPQRVKVPVLFREDGSVVAGPVVVYRGPRGKRGYPANMAEVAQMIADYFAEKGGGGGGDSIPWAMGAVYYTDEGASGYTEVVIGTDKDGSQTRLLNVHIPPPGAGGGGIVSVGYGIAGAGQAAYAQIENGNHLAILFPAPASGGGSSNSVGSGNAVSGTDAFAAGQENVASSLQSVAFGWRTVSSGFRAVSTGAETKALGHNSVVMGNSTHARMRDSFARGSTEWGQFTRRYQTTYATLFTKSSGSDATEMRTSGFPAVNPGAYVESTLFLTLPADTVASGLAHLLVRGSDGSLWTGRFRFTASTNGAVVTVHTQATEWDGGTGPGSIVASVGSRVPTTGAAEFSYVKVAVQGVAWDGPTYKWLADVELREMGNQF
ncbi:MAG TPA: hypothetical protein VF576_05410 [Rubricoccaceae bacterium]|jgi:hypothetical protein